MGLFLYPNKLENMKGVDFNMARVTKIDSTSERPEQRRRFKKLKANKNQPAIQETPSWRIYLSNQHGQMEYFTLDGHYKVLERSGIAIKVEIGSDPVWVQVSFTE